MKTILKRALSSRTPHQQVQFNIQKRLRNINQLSGNLVRQTSKNESIFSFETALQNSTIVVKEKIEIYELPTYDELIKDKSSLTSDNNEIISTL